MSINKVLITGARGFVGSEILKQLDKKYRQVLTIENKRVYPSEEILKKSGLSFAVDLTNRESVLSLKKIGTVDAVIHSAGLAHQFGATSREKFQRVNVAGTANVLELARKLKVKHFVLISSVSVYGHKHSENQDRELFATIKQVDETTKCFPEDFYAESKLDGENLARELCEKNRIKLTILRLATVIGEEDKGNFLHLIRRIDRRRFVWIGKGENFKSFVHREDVARACLTVLKNAESEKEINNFFNVFNISADALKMSEIVEIIAAKLGRKIPPVKIPAAFAGRIIDLISRSFARQKINALKKTIEKWLADDVYSAEKIKREYGFRFQVSAKKAIEREVEWYMANN